MQQAIIRRAALVAALAVTSCVAAASGWDKNGGAPAASPAPIVDGSVAAGGLPATFVNCTEHVRFVETTAAAFTPIATCTLKLPVDGTVLVMASGYAKKDTNPEAGYEAIFGIAVDGSTSTQAPTFRWLDVVTGSTESAGSFATNTLVPMTAGTHTFGLSAYRTHGTVPASIEYATVFALLIPSASNARTCSASGTNASATGTTPLLLGECTITVPEDSLALVIGSAAGALAGNASANDYEAQYSVSVDTLGGDNDVDRWINLYSDATTTDGADDVMTVTSGRPVTAGAHTFRFYMTRSGGTGVAGVYRRTLSVVTIPTALHAACAGVGNSNTELNAIAATTLKTCPLNVAQAGSLLMLGNTSALASASSEFTMYTQTGSGNANFDSRRSLQLRGDTGDGSDRAGLALSVEPRAPGPVTVGANAYVSTGTTAMTAYDATVIGLVMPPTQLALFADGFE